MVEVHADTRPADAVASEKDENPNALVEPKHLLEHNWTLWFFRNDRSKDWKENQVQVATFDTVEDFWALYNHVESAGRLPSGCDYSLFKAGIRPEWEDERNCDGGRWLITLERGNKENVDKYWMELLMMMIGEAFDTENQYICGAVVSLRGKVDRIALWISCGTNQEESTMKIGRRVVERLSLGEKQLTFQTHKDTSSKTGSSAKATFVV